MHAPCILNCRYLSAILSIMYNITLTGRTLCNLDVLATAPNAPHLPSPSNAVLAIHPHPHICLSPRHCIPRTGYPHDARQQRHAVHAIRSFRGTAAVVDTVKVPAMMILEYWSTRVLVMVHHAVNMCRVQDSQTNRTNAPSRRHNAASRADPYSICALALRGSFRKSP